MPTQTRAAFLAEYRAAKAAGDDSRIVEITLAAIAYDAEHPAEPRLMDEIRGLNTPAAA